jgi:hypothetical protein
MPKTSSSGHSNRGTIGSVCAENSRRCLFVPETRGAVRNGHPRRLVLSTLARRGLKIETDSHFLPQNGCEFQGVKTISAWSQSQVFAPGAHSWAPICPEFGRYISGRPVRSFTPLPTVHDRGVAPSHHHREAETKSSIGTAETNIESGQLDRPERRFAYERQ